MGMCGLEILDYADKWPSEWPLSHQQELIAVSGWTGHAWCVGAGTDPRIDICIRQTNHQKHCLVSAEMDAKPTYGH